MKLRGQQKKSFVWSCLYNILRECVCVCFSYITTPKWTKNNQLLAFMTNQLFCAFCCCCVAVVIIRTNLSTIAHREGCFSSDKLCFKDFCSLFHSLELITAERGNKVFFLFLVQVAITRQQLSFRGIVLLQILQIRTLVSS